MSKNITTNLAGDLSKGVVTTAVLIEVVRNDGKAVRLTNHDTPITFEEKIYQADVPFTLSAIQSGSDLGSDNCEIEIAVDEVVIKKDEVNNGLYKNGNVRIMQVNWQAPENGAMTLRRGWFSRLESNKNGSLKIEVFGLLKLLDFTVGRVFQPSCDADLGDKRCRVAVDFSQAYSPLNAYKAGDWVYKYETSALTVLTLTNPSFEFDGDVADNGTITGWTKSPSSKWEVNNVSTYQGPSIVAQHGSYFLEGSPDADAEGEEQYVYQDLLLTSGGPAAIDIDDGQIMFVLFTSVMQTSYLLDPPRVVCEVYDAAGVLLETRDTNYFTLDTKNVWREKCLAFPLVPTARRVRIYLYAKRVDANIANVMFDNVRAYYYNHTLTAPTNGRIYRMCRVTRRGQDLDLYYAPNGSFEAQGSVSNSSSNTVGAGGITSWTKGSGSYWAVDTGGETDGDYYLSAGNDGSGVQRVYTISTTFDAATASGVNSARILLGKLAGVIYGDIYFETNTGRAEVEVQFLSSTNTLLGSTTAYALNNPSPSAAGGTLSFDKGFTCPLNTAKIKVVLSAETPSGSSVGNVGFDNFRFQFYDPDNPVIADPVSGVGEVGTVFDTDAGEYTFDGALLWVARTDHAMFDRVATVVDRKTFNGTAISGVEGSYETGLIRWLSGDNAGAYNLIRTWDPNDKKIKLYFPTISPIQAGDRYTYVRSCQKRFIEDCVTRYDNGLNFQGFPYLPGRID